MNDLAEKLDASFQRWDGLMARLRFSDALLGWVPPRAQNLICFAGLGWVGGVWWTTLSFVFRFISFCLGGGVKRVRVLPCILLVDLVVPFLKGIYLVLGTFLGET